MEKEKSEFTFKVLEIVCPRFEGHFSMAPQKENYLQAYRVDVEIYPDRILLVFGTRLASEEKLGDNHLVEIICEIGGVFLIKDKLPSKIETYKDLPALANMMAILFPYIREKISGFAASNAVKMLLQPTNMHVLLENKEGQLNIGIFDHRSIENPINAKPETAG